MNSNKCQCGIPSYCGSAHAVQLGPAFLPISRLDRVTGFASLLFVHDGVTPYLRSEITEHLCRIHRILEQPWQTRRLIRQLARKKPDFLIACRKPKETQISSSVLTTTKRLGTLISDHQ